MKMCHLSSTIFWLPGRWSWKPPTSPSLAFSACLLTRPSQICGVVEGAGIVG